MRPLPLLLVVFASPASSQEPASRAQRLFLDNCARCHGERGDGQGTTELDRPARSFQEGGFSFGNTPEALFRTISVGIPGTPMPGFDSSLSEEERRLLAEHVLTLGPPIEEVQPEDTILEVHDRPLVVRGLLPALAEGLPEHARGLLIGDPSGITFEYRVDDVRLLALRQGGFVRRTDWSGRGGTPLEPLGKVVHLVAGGQPETFFLSAGQPLVARLSSTSQRAREVELEYHLIDAARAEIAHVREIPHVLTAPFGTGFTRQLQLVPSAAGAQLELRCKGLAVGGELHALELGDGARGAVVRGPELPYVCFALRTDAPLDECWISTSGEIDAFLRLPGGPSSALLTTLVLTEWNEGLRAQLETLLGR